MPKLEKLDIAFLDVRDTYHWDEEQWLCLCYANLDKLQEIRLVVDRHTLVRLESIKKLLSVHSTIKHFALGYATMQVDRPEHILQQNA
jgi:hypothetical protein